MLSFSLRFIDRLQRLNIIRPLFLLCLLTCLLSSCAVVPKNRVKAKKKITRLKEKIDNIAAYHKLDSIWFQRRKIELNLPPINREIGVTFIVNKETIIDSLLVEYSKVDSTDQKKIRNKILDSLISEEIIYEDSLLYLKVNVKPNGYDINYEIKEQNITHEIICETVYIDTGLLYYQQRGYWVTVIILFLVIVGLFYLFRYK